MLYADSSVHKIPEPLFNIWRAWDRRGGTNSQSVRRFVGDEASEALKQLQYRFNELSRSSVFRRMAWGTFPRQGSGQSNSGLPGQPTWESISIPVCLIAGEKDHVTPRAEADKIE